jgi:ABC-2 type transport system permease protein
VHVHRRPRNREQVLDLAVRTVRDRWRSILAWGLGMVLIAVVQLSVYPSVASSSAAMQTMVEQWPAPLREAFGLSDYGTGAGYLNSELFTFVVPLMLVAVAVGAAVAATAAEEERGTADLLLSLPVRRSVVLVGKVLALVAAMLVVGAALALTLVVGSPVVDLEVATSGVLAATTMSVLLGLVFGAVALLLGALTGRRAVAMGAAIGLAISALLLNALAPLADWLEPWQALSPFHWAYGERPLQNGLDAAGAALLLAATVVALAAAGVAFARRDVRTV